MNELDNYLQDQETYDLHPAEIATLLKELNDEDFDSYVARLPKEIIGDVALELPDRYFGNLVENLSVDELSVAVTELESDDQTDFMQELEEVDKDVAKAVFESLGKEDQEEITHLKQYDEDEAGAYMQLEVFTATEEETVQTAIKRFAQLREENVLENIQNLFITEENGKLKYSIGLDDLLIFDFKKTFKEIIEAHKENFEPQVARTRQDIHDVVHCIEEFNLGVIPVVDSKGILVGRITSDDVYDIINEKATEQMYNLAGVDDDAEEDDAIIKAGKKRAIWLLLNLFTAILASFVISMFEESLHTLVALAILMPIVASMGGNAGTQSLTVVVRQLALGEISEGDGMRIVRKEVIISLLNGMFFAVLVGIVASLWFDKWMLGLVIALSMLINLFAAGFFGAFIPLLLKRLQVDPAIGSTVLLTTITDVVGFLSFLGLATAILL